MNCWGRTAKLERCRNRAKFLFCRHHRWQLWVAVVPVIAAIAMWAGLYRDLLLPIWEHLFPSEALYPVFTITTRRSIPLNEGSRTASSSELETARTHTLELENPNLVPFTNVEILLQFPEIIPRTIRCSEKLASIEPNVLDPELIYEPNLEISNRLVEINDGPMPSLLWRIDTPIIHAKSPLVLVFTSYPLSKEPGFSNIADLYGHSGSSGIPWYATVRYNDPLSHRKKSIHYRIHFDSDARQVTSISLLSESEKGNLVKIVHMRGLRAQGIYDIQNVVASTFGKEAKISIQTRSVAPNVSVNYRHDFTTGAPSLRISQTRDRQLSTSELDAIMSDDRPLAGAFKAFVANPRFPNTPAWKAGHKSDWCAFLTYRNKLVHAIPSNISAIPRIIDWRATKLRHFGQDSINITVEPVELDGHEQASQEVRLSRQLGQTTHEMRSHQRSITIETETLGSDEDGIFVIARAVVIEK